MANTKKHVLSHKLKPAFVEDRIENPPGTHTEPSPFFRPCYFMISLKHKLSLADVYKIIFLEVIHTILKTDQSSLFLDHRNCIMFSDNTALPPEQCCITWQSLLQIQVFVFRVISTRHTTTLNRHAWNRTGVLFIMLQEQQEQSIYFFSHMYPAVLLNTHAHKQKLWQLGISRYGRKQNLTPLFLK